MTEFVRFKSNFIAVTVEVVSKAARVLQYKVASIIYVIYVSVNGDFEFLLAQ